MRLAKKAIVAVEISNHLPELLRELREMDFLAHSEIQFVHVFNTVTYSFGLGEFPLVYPVESDRKTIERSGIELLAQVTEKVLPRNFAGKASYRILFNDDPKWRFANHVKEEKADLVIIPTRSKHGLFDSSFAQYVNKHTDCNLILLKHKD